MPGAAVPTSTDPVGATEQLPEAPARRSFLHRTGLFAGCLAGSWVLPVLTHATGLDILLVLIIVIAAMALVRGGRTVLDRFIVAVTLLFGTLCVAAIVMTWWPWGLGPVPVAGTALSILVVLYAVAGRRPALSSRFGLPDWFTLAWAAVLALLVLRQFVKRDAVGRLALVAPGEDLARHFALFDAIGKVDGYAFLHPGAARRFVPVGHEYYPQGLHMLYAVLDRFWRSATHNATGPVAMDWFMWCNVFTFVFFGLALLWALRRIGGPELSGWKSGVVLGGAAGYIFFGDPITVFMRGFPNELAGLAFVAILVALAVRPLYDTREQILTMAALLVGIGFTYYLFLPAAGVVALAWLVVRRRRTLKRPVTLALGVVFAAAAAIPVVTNPVANEGRQLLLAGTAVAVNHHVVLALLLVIAAGLLTRSALRSPAWRMVLLADLAAVATLLAIFAYQYLELHKTIYYYEKAYHLVMTTAIISLGVLARLLPAVAPGSGPWRVRLRPLLPSIALVLSVFALFGAFNGAPSSTTGGSWGTGLFRGREGVKRTGLEVAFWASRQYQDGDGKVTVDLSHGGWADFFSTYYGTVMQREYNAAIGWSAFVRPDTGPKTLDDMEQLVRQPGSWPIRFVVSDPKARFLVLDKDTMPVRSVNAPPSDTGDQRAMTNIEAARYLAWKYPTRVEVVTFEV